MRSEQTEVSRDALINVYRQQNLHALNNALASGEWTQAEAAIAHALFMQSNALQDLVSRDVMALGAMLDGQVH